MDADNKLSVDAVAVVDHRLAYSSLLEHEMETSPLDCNIVEDVVAEQVEDIEGNNNLEENDIVEPAAFLQVIRVAYDIHRVSCVDNPAYSKGVECHHNRASDLVAEEVVGLWPELVLYVVAENWVALPRNKYQPLASTIRLYNVVKLVVDLSPYSLLSCCDTVYP